jgi:hypothetical protein
MKTSLLALAFLLLITIPFATRADEACKVLLNWHSVPESVRNTLNHDIGPIAERGGAFNPTDVFSDDTPHNRFFGACLRGNRIVVAIERGGMASAFELVEFVDDKKIRQWYRPTPSGPFTPAVAVPPAGR